MKQIKFEIYGDFDDYTFFQFNENLNNSEYPNPQNPHKMMKQQAQNVRKKVIQKKE